MKPSLLMKSFEPDVIKKAGLVLPEFLPLLKIGAFVAVDVLIKEGEKARLQPFSGLLVNYHKAGVNSTVTISRFSGNTRVVRIFPIYSEDVHNLQVLFEKQKAMKRNKRKNIKVSR